MKDNTAIVITSIASPNKVLREFASRCKEYDFTFILIGDARSPGNFELEGCDFYNIPEQEKLPFKLAKVLPVNHYSRKNIGYLLAIQKNSQKIIETDDDNFPLENFWDKKTIEINSPVLENTGWINVYRYFTNKFIWPRGFPLEKIRSELPDISQLKKTQNHCPIQSGLTNSDPDVDAIFRMTQSLPVEFNKFFRIAAGKKSWCPFNSQNSTWFSEVFPLLYLPSYCSIRVTDIWRSFIAQRICQEYDWKILFHYPTVHQERNKHDNKEDFFNELPGYLNNYEICRRLENLDLKNGIDQIFENMIRCYEVFFSMHLIDKNEIKLLECWFDDLQRLAKNTTN